MRNAGRPGVVLVTEGPAGRVDKLVAKERRRIGPVIQNVPIHVIKTGKGEGQVPLRRLSKEMKKLDKKLTQQEVQTVHMPVLAHPDHSPADDDTEFELGKEWAIGFVEGVAMRENAWEDWRAIDWVEEDLAWLSVLAGYEIDPPKPLTWAERDAMVAEIPDMLYALNEQRVFQQSPKQPIRSDAKPGRNDPCPCGSGQKYKKCCGISRTLH